LTPNSRSYLNRWAQPDTIIPDPYNPQDYDRYSYVRNDPVNRNDPSGHCSLMGHWEDDSSPACQGASANNGSQSGNLNTAKLTAGPEIPIIIITVIGIIVGTLDYDNRSHRSGERCSYSETYADCFNSNRIIKFSHNQQIDMGQFIGLLDAIYTDLNRMPRTSIDVARTEYDTPFYTGNSNTLLGIDSSTNRQTDETVCFGDNCYLQSDVNYIGEGTYAAAAGESIDSAKSDADAWKRLNGHYATSDTYYWLIFGYGYYLYKKDHP